MLDWINVKQNCFDYYLTYKRIYVPISPLEAAHLTVKYITERYPPPYTLMLSGGVDSQATLYAWHTSGVEFKTLSAIYNENLNNHDLQTIIEFSKQLNIDINFINFDLFNFLFTEHESYVHKYRCGSPHMTTFMKISEHITEGTVIMSGNFILPGQQVLPITKNNFALYRYAKENQKSMVPFFFLETDQLAFSFDKYGVFINPRTVPGNQQPMVDTKVNLYHKGGFPVISQNQKLTGFEQVKNYFDANFKHLVTLQDKLSITPQVSSKRTFDLLLRNKYELRYYADKYVTRVEYAEQA